MTEWGSGYVTDIEYTLGYFHNQSPSHLATACLMGGVACDVFDRYDNLSYIELGCGQGFGAMVLAASNPGWTVTAIDFNPTHIASARSYAAAAGLANITFLEADLTTLAEDPEAALVPEADVVSLHGLWSWVPDAVRDGITRLLRSKLRPGGLVHLSYNAMPAWQSALGMQRLVREAGLRLASRSDRQVQAGFEVVKALNAAEAGHLHKPAFVKALLERLTDLPLEYLAHEYMNESWRPCFHVDVARALAGAKLEWVAAAELIENFPELTFTKEQRAVVERFDDPIMRELIKDTCLSRGLRQDVFVRGARRISAAARNAALGRLTLALTVAPEDFQYEADMPTGRAEFGRAFYGAVVEALSSGPKTVAELTALPGRAVLMARPEALPDATARRFNAVSARRLMRVDRIGLSVAMASVRLGAGLHCPLLDLYVLDHGLAAGTAMPDAAVLADQVGAMLEPDEREKLLTAIVKSSEKRAPIWHAAGVI
jgi:SAM-dependent methyltransferase